MSHHIAAICATLGPVGRVFPAPGTAGSLVALIVGYGLLQLGWLTLLIATIVSCVVGIWSANIYEHNSGKKDASEVVIDEVAGQWMTLLFVPASLPWALAAFLMFRLFDIIKPGPVKLAEQLPSGTGVMADDIVAASLAGMVLLALQVAVEMARITS